MQLAGQSERWTRGAMGTSAAVLLLFAAAACVLRTRAQVPPYRSAATVITNQCLPEEALAEQIADQDLSDTLRLIAERLSNGTKNCLDKIYVIAFTGSSSAAGSTHPHNFEVVGAGQTSHIVLPDRPGDYTVHRGDIWKLDVIDDLHFLPGTCLRLCNIKSVTVREGGTNGWLIDSIMTYGCMDDLGCSALTQDIDVNRWVDGNGFGDVQQIPLTLVSQSYCV